MSGQITDTGVWDLELAKRGHRNEPILASLLSEMFRDSLKPVFDFGCGTGYYLAELQKSGFQKEHLFGLEGTPDISQIAAFDNIQTQDLSQPFDLQKVGNVIYLEVWEHIPAEFEDVYIQNLLAHCSDWLIVSCAVPGQKGDGHVNCRTNLEVQKLIWEKSLEISKGNPVIYKDAETARFRRYLKNASCWWFKDTIMVFQRLSPFGALSAGVM